MGKIHNITAGLMMAGAALGINGQEAVAQTPGNKNNKANIEKIQKNTSKELIGLDQYDYKKMLDMDISLLSNEVIVRLVFDRTNEIRQSHGLNKLKYNHILEDISTNFSKEKIGTKRREDKFSHFDKNNFGPYERVTRSKIKDDLNLFTKKDGEIKGIGENLSTANNSVKCVLEGLINSKYHREAILCPYINIIGISYEKDANLIVQLFANIKAK